MDSLAACSVGKMCQKIMSTLNGTAMRTIQAQIQGPSQSLRASLKLVRNVFPSALVLGACFCGLR